MRAAAVLLLVLLAGCGQEQPAQTEVHYDGSYVPCKGTTHPSPQPDHPACRGLG